MRPNLGVTVNKPASTQHLGSGAGFVSLFWFFWDTSWLESLSWLQIWSGDSPASASWVLGAQVQATVSSLWFLKCARADFLWLSLRTTVYLIFKWPLRRLPWEKGRRPEWSPYAWAPLAPKSQHHSQLSPPFCSIHLHTTLSERPL